MSEEKYILEFKINESLSEKLNKIKDAVNWLCHEMQQGRVNNNNIALKKETSEMKTSLSIAFVKMVENGEIDEVTASENANMFISWSEFGSYNINDYRTYKGKLYKCLQAHTGQIDWTPDVSTSLWKEVGITESGIPEWSQPISSADAYMIGDEVIYNGVHYKSLIDNNVWSPETYSQGWEVVVDDN